MADQAKAPSATRTATSSAWRTSLTCIEPNKVLVRGYPLDEMMGRVGFADAVYLLLVGELPSPSVSRMITAILVSSVDHGAMPPSTVVSRNVATTGAPLRAAVAAGVLSSAPIMAVTSKRAWTCWIAAWPWCATATATSMPRRRS